MSRKSQNLTVYSVHSCFTITSPSLCSFFLSFHSFFQYFHCNLWIATRENKASSCFSCWHDILLLCRNSTLIFPVKIEAQWQVEPRSESKVYSNQSVRGWCHFSLAITLCNEVFTSEWQVKAEKLSTAKLSNLHLTPSCVSRGRRQSRRAVMNQSGTSRSSSPSCSLRSANAWRSRFETRIRSTTLP